MADAASVGAEAGSFRHVGGVIIHDDAPARREVCIMNDAAPAESGGTPAMTSAVANTIMLPTAPNGSRVLSMTLTAATTPRCVGGVVNHDDAALENEVCIMNDAAPVLPRPAIPSFTPPRPPRAR